MTAPLQREPGREGWEIALEERRTRITLEISLAEARQLRAALQVNGSRWAKAVLENLNGQMEGKV